MKRFLVPLVLLILAACTQVPTPVEGVRPDLTPLVFGGPGEEGVDSLAKHSTGVYAVGFTTNTGRPNPQGEIDVFVRKYSSNRSVIWTRRFGTPEFEFVEGAASDGSDNVYVVGSTYGDLARARGGEDVFILKYTSTGSVAWTRQFGTGSVTGTEDNLTFDFAKGVATYGSNAVYVVGRADGKLRGSVGSGVLFIRKYTASGSVTWTRQFGFSDPVDGFDYVSDVAVDGGGNAYVVGATDRSLGTKNSGDDMFIRKYSPKGNVLWTRQLNFSGRDFAQAVAVSGSNVYVGVSYVTDKSDQDNTDNGVRIVKFSTSGVRAKGWGYVYNSAGSDYVEDLSTDRNGNIYFSGSTESTTRFDTDGIVVKLNPSGARVWGKRVASSENESANAVLARTTSEIYVAGITDGVLGAANRGNIDPFLRRLRGSDGRTVWTEQ